MELSWDFPYLSRRVPVLSRAKQLWPLPPRLDAAANA